MFLHYIDGSSVTIPEYSYSEYNAFTPFLASKPQQLIIKSGKRNSQYKKWTLETFVVRL